MDQVAESFNSLQAYTIGFVTNILAERSVRDWTHRGCWKFPELTERSEVSSGNFQQPEARPIPDSPNLQVYVWFLPHTSSHTHCSSLRYIRRCFVNIFSAKKIAGLLILLLFYYLFIY